MSKNKITYADAGVDVERGYEAISLIKNYAKSTYDKNVLSQLGSFSGFYSLGDFGGFSEPVLVSGTDGVGTKLKYAFLSGKNDTVGIDCVAMCANDVVCHGAKPLFFLDYLATGKLMPKVAAEIVYGISEGCKMSGCALIGGETAEMPSFYPEGEYDLAGFCVGIVDKSKIINGSRVECKDKIIGFASSGLHSNGYSLVRKLLGYDLKKLQDDTSLGEPLIDILLKPTRIYVKTVLELIKNFDIHGIAHITGGGFIENIPRMFNEGKKAVININSYDCPPVFKLLKKLSNLDDCEMYNTFNMGIGMALAVPASSCDAVLKAAQRLGEKAYIIGEVANGSGVELVS